MKFEFDSIGDAVCHGIPFDNTSIEDHLSGFETIETDRPEYDNQTQAIVAGEQVRSGEMTANDASALLTGDAAVVVATDQTQATANADEQGTGNQDVLGA